MLTADFRNTLTATYGMEISADDFYELREEGGYCHLAKSLEGLRFWETDLDGAVLTHVQGVWESAFYLR